MTPATQQEGTASAVLTPERGGGWIQTFTGVAFYPLDARPEEINIRDIAHALSMQCRFTGHCRSFYSIAEHSVRVSMLCDPKDAMWGLLHDASEAYLCDLARPIKRLPELVPYRDAETRLQAAIAIKFGLPTSEPESVQLADKTMLAMEARDLMGPLLPGWDKWDRYLAGVPYRIGRTWTPGEAEEIFINRFNDLKNPLIRRDITIAEAASVMGKYAATKRKRMAKSAESPLFADAA